MTLQDVESAAAHLSPEELTAFAAWFEQFLAEAWDRLEASDEVARLSEPALDDWNRPEEDEAWSHLQGAMSSEPR